MWWLTTAVAVCTGDGTRFSSTRSQLANQRAGLAKNECLERRRAGARLLQIGEQSLAMGLKFKARVVLDIEEHPAGLAQQLISDEASSAFACATKCQLARSRWGNVCLRCDGGSSAWNRCAWRSLCEHV
jgi:hypothetical protein